MLRINGDLYMLKSCFNYCFFLFSSPPEENSYHFKLLALSEPEESLSSIDELKKLIINAIPIDHDQHHKIEINGVVEVSYHTHPLNGYSILIQHIGSKTQSVYQGRSTESYEQACAHLFSGKSKHSILQDAPAIITPY